MAAPRTSPARAKLFRAVNLLWQRVAYVGFHQRDISGIDRAIEIHVLTEVRAIDWYAYLRLGQGDVPGIDASITSHITGQDAHRNRYITSARTIVHVMQRDGNPLNVGYATEIDRDLWRAAPAEAVHISSTRRH